MGGVIAFFVFGSDSLNPPSVLPRVWKRQKETMNKKENLNIIKMLPIKLLRFCNYIEYTLVYTPNHNYNVNLN